ncbi:dTDP-4-dehydrorhamnose 3,5-epimerase [Aurantimonas aggregata]|uniref:dTDP-4-dehydrorhamnose 3,5-epimerase n=1 Tax=Aurantimonas aggregata TaxID=2047720 RepID=A0A6L9MMF1_9HYPH|nr:dTDP-4-dehydrorhamnose 3,5-epimerase [Aurantimonas aggregata]NDV89027.1 dTDP-4-dehydrorhamnose 3,5-epimerase [Aurantimonas aggregata]
MLTVRSLALPEVREIVPQKFGDERGWFAEVYQMRRFAEAGISCEWVQDNQSYSASAYTLRGLHYQEPPFAQDKLVRVLRGKILDVAVDIRRGSPRFGKWVALELSATAFNQIFVPAGFAHGFLTLEPETEVLYKVSAPYSAAHDRSIRWDDPEIGVAWGLADLEPALSTKDRAAPLLRDVEPGFEFKAGDK